ncbi:hypothetical protein [Cognatishimia sp. F0-27]|uniref:hypothetical protein n=1 Tax=Cognatishimia sp. F0-27 TaxID=2816855 RepID=UPI001D0C77A6|nr:hypothetical protein [Cognatishimia sp. F0-27]MCC1492083.1 hypothetical protein [Cognatishimia sp. F0-27]
MQRSLSAIALAMMLAVTSLQMAVAQGQPRAEGQIVICKGMTVVTISVDADGNPVETVGVCPDYALSLFMALPDMPGMLVPAPVVGSALPLPDAVVLRLTPERPLNARAPPWSV